MRLYLQRSRIFERATLQKHYEYIALCPKEHQPLLHIARDVNNKATPDSTEKISWQMPTFYQNEKFKGMTKEQYEQSENLSALLAQNLKIAVSKNAPSCVEAQTACDLHRQWLSIFWADGMYSKERHMGLAQMYCDDERFKAYYEAITPGCAEFLRNSMLIYTKE